MASWNSFIELKVALKVNNTQTYHTPTPHTIRISLKNKKKKNKQKTKMEEDQQNIVA